jgi:hypothetical protein
MPPYRSPRHSHSRTIIPKRNRIRLKTKNLKNQNLQEHALTPMTVSSGGTPAGDFWFPCKAVAAPGPKPSAGSENGGLTMAWVGAPTADTVDGQIEHGQISGALLPPEAWSGSTRTSLVLSGGFEPIDFPLFHGVWRGSSSFRNGSLCMLVSSVCTERQHASFSARGHLRSAFGAFRPLVPALSMAGSRNLTPSRHRAAA